MRRAVINAPARCRTHPWHLRWVFAHASFKKHQRDVSLSIWICRSPCYFNDSILELFDVINENRYLCEEGQGFWAIAFWWSQRRKYILDIWQCRNATNLRFWRDSSLNLVDANSESGALCKEAFGSGAIQSLSLLTSSMKMERNVQKPLVLERFCLWVG